MIDARWLAIALIVSLPTIASACPTCKNDLPHSGTEFGFAASILFLMAMPFSIFAAWTIAIIRMRRIMSNSVNDELLAANSELDDR